MADSGSKVLELESGHRTAFLDRFVQQQHHCSLLINVTMTAHPSSRVQMTKMNEIAIVETYHAGLSGRVVAIEMHMLMRHATNDDNRSRILIHHNDA